VTVYAASMNKATVAFDPMQLRLLRKRAKLTQDDLAAVAGVTRQAISLIEHGRRRPRPATLAALVTALQR
jgi:transcriptional regulator with XRE-family HTH domain